MYLGKFGKSKRIPKLKRKDARIAGTYAEHNLFSDNWVTKPGEGKVLLDLHGQTASTILPSYADLQAEAAEEMDYYGYEVYLCSDKANANVMLRVFRAEYKNVESGITGGRFGAVAYVKDRSGKHWVTKDRAHHITVAENTPTIKVRYSVSRAADAIMLNAPYEDYYFRVAEKKK